MIVVSVSAKELSGVQYRMISALVLAAATVTAFPSQECVAAAHRVMGFLIEEANGTRHEEQIANKIEEAGSADKAAVDLAATLVPGQCVFIITAPDSTVRALAISMLPERQGQ
ncbi:hypothetical protein [Ferirhizobium litorale]|uniref:Uncharacterized protein n=1 Tax=Ferirhizobium litorale TaxID=2927786 RepID=A0AAE3U368_9HYPH|nr:hypothetical protein [Fererhizobium litorale]MDI7923427.1 hypothetical protein [Fererhizobium litorale]